MDAEGRKTLRRGARGYQVEQVQLKVGVVASGIFDAGTEAAVRRFQRDYELVPDGIVGPRTWATLDTVP
jgi:peptidoglycan hydrolase-like protein with peptidoglycan-binding domain